MRQFYYHLFQGQTIRNSFDAAKSVLRVCGSKESDSKSVEDMLLLPSQNSHNIKLNFRSWKPGSLSQTSDILTAGHAPLGQTLPSINVDFAHHTRACFGRNSFSEHISDTLFSGASIAVTSQAPITGAKSCVREALKVLRFRNGMKNIIELHIVFPIQLDFVLNEITSALLKFASSYSIDQSKRDVLMPSSNCTRHQVLIAIFDFEKLTEVSMRHFLESISIFVGHKNVINFVFSSSGNGDVIFPLVHSSSRGSIKQIKCKPLPIREAVILFLRHLDAPVRLLDYGCKSSEVKYYCTFCCILL